MLHTLRRNISEMNSEIDALTMIRDVLDCIVERLGKGSKKYSLLMDSELTEIIESIAPAKSNIQEAVTMTDVNNANEILNKNLTVRIVMLPPCTVASYRAEGENPEVTKPAEEIKPVEETRPVEGESFVGLFWTRETDVDTEYLHFSPKGDYSYYCACGNPVNDSDLCESYSYNPDTGTISLQCFAVTDSMVTEITVVKCDGEILVLDFDGDIRTFVKENN